MTEAEWLARDNPAAMLEFLQAKPGPWWLVPCVCCLTACAQRPGLCPAYRLRLFACACGRRQLPTVADPSCPRAVEAAEQHADGYLGEMAAGAAAEFDLRRRSRFPKHETPDDWAWNAAYCALHRRWMSRCDDMGARERWHLAWAVIRDAATSGGAAEAPVLAALLRDVFGNPFASVSIDPAWRSWRSGTVVRLAGAAYDDRLLPAGTLDPGRLAVLADALEDAGSTDADLLNHLRGPGPHVRGCWAVDLLLGRG
jgi:hypothetical protein